ncbi:protein kinase domain-containing protein [Actinomadura napierensis]
MSSTRRMAPSVTLTLVKGRLDHKEFVFDERATCVLGRSSDCSPRLPDDEHHRRISRHHCLIDINPPAARIRDFGSLNGTYVNGRRIGKRERHQTPEEAALLTYPEHDLADGDEIRLGDTVFRVGIHAPGTGEWPSGDELSVPSLDPADIAALLQEIARGENATLIPGYTILRELGRGGMGAVYLARDDATGAEVALKLMLPRVAVNPTSRARFLREAELTSMLRHPNIAALHDLGSSGGVFYFTIEYCARGSLDRLVSRRGGRLPAGEAVPLFLQVLDGLEHAHDQGVVHRDLSPSNILLHEADTGTLVAKVADFGLAKAFDQAGLSGLTRTGATAGKPVFMARRQVIDFKNAAPAVDVWAAAACLYHSLSGAVPRDFPPGKDPWRIVLQAPPVPLRERAPDVPRALAGVVDIALREKPTFGFTTAAQFRDALLAC